MEYLSSNVANNLLIAEFMKASYRTLCLLYARFLGFKPDILRVFTEVDKMKVYSFIWKDDKKMKKDLQNNGNSKLSVNFNACLISGSYSNCVSNLHQTASIGEVSNC